MSTYFYRRSNKVKSDLYLLIEIVVLDLGSNEVKPMIFSNKASLVRFKNVGTLIGTHVHVSLT